MTGPAAGIASTVMAVAVRAAVAIEAFLSEATAHGLSRDEAMAVLHEANEWALARARCDDPVARARQLLQERAQ